MERAAEERAILASSITPQRAICVHKDRAICQFRTTRRSSFPAHVAALIDGRGCRQCDRRWLGSPAGSHRPKRTSPNRRMSRGTWRRPYTQDLHRHSGLFSVAGEPILKPPAQTTIISGQSLAHSRKLASCFSARSASGLLVRQLVDVGFIDCSSDSQDDADQQQRLGSKFSPTA